MLSLFAIQDLESVLFDSASWVYLLKNILIELGLLQVDLIRYIF